MLQDWSNTFPWLCFFSAAAAADRHGAGGWGLARGGEGRTFGPRCCLEVGVRCFLSAWTSGATEPVQEERDAEDCFYTHQTQGDDMSTAQTFFEVFESPLNEHFPPVHGPVVPGGGGLGAGAAPGGQGRAERGVTRFEESGTGIQSKRRGGEVSGEAERSVGQPLSASRCCQQPATTVLWWDAAQWSHSSIMNQSFLFLIVMSAESQSSPSTLPQLHYL